MNDNIYQNNQNLIQKILNTNIRNYWLRQFCKTTIRIRNKKFTFNGAELNYNSSAYNESSINERAVEISIALNFLSKKKKVLEIGNVLPHYHKVKWQVVDKFEKAKNVLNTDVFEYKSKTKFDQIISVSTIEHIGIDDSISNPRLGVAAIKKLKNLLKKNGEMLITIPIGYSPILDKNFLKKGIFDHVYAMKRTSPWNTWKQVDPNSVKNAKYGWPYNNANAIFIGYFKKP